MENKDQPDKIEQCSPSLASERLEHLKQLFPECFTEGKIDFPKLREILGISIRVFCIAFVAPPVGAGSPRPPFGNQTRLL